MKTNIEGTKYCPKCGEIKDLSEFGNDKYKKSGKCVHCKACRKLYRIEHKEQEQIWRKKEHVNIRRNQNKWYETTGKYTKRENLNKFFSTPIDVMQSYIRYDSQNGHFYAIEADIQLKESTTAKKYLAVWLPMFHVHCKANRLAWFMATGEWADQVDHIDGDRMNNSLSNLRACSNRENGCNKEKHRTGGLVGATFDKNKNKWVSRVMEGDGYKQLGRFSSERDASLCYCRYVLKHNLVRREFLPDVFTDEELGI